MSLSPVSLEDECCVWELADRSVSHMAGGEDVGPLEDVLVCWTMVIGAGFVLAISALALEEGCCNARTVWEGYIKRRGDDD